MSGSVEAVPPAAACARSVAASLAPGGQSRSSISFRSPALRRGNACRQSGLGWKCRRNGLKRLNPRREMVWPRRPWTPQYVVETGAATEARRTWRSKVSLQSLIP